MIRPNYVPTKDLFQALVRAKRAFARTSDDVEPIPTMTPPANDDGSSLSSRDELVAEHE